jgi:hypothetical protein
VTEGWQPNGDFYAPSTAALINKYGRTGAIQIIASMPTELEAVGPRIEDADTFGNFGLLYSGAQYNEQRIAGAGDASGEVMLVMRSKPSDFKVTTRVLAFPTREAALQAIDAMGN